jgi:polyisoprenoid-binding protein YceI
MAKWEFEPGHTAAEFRAKHMMVTWVRGHFKDLHGVVDLDFDNPTGSSFEAVIDATGLWPGEPERDAHLRSADFFDVEHYPWITFKSTRVEQVGSVLYKVTGNLTIRGVTRPVTLDVQHLGQWGDALLGGRGQQRGHAPGGVLGHDADQPPRLRGELERPARQGRGGGQRRGLREPGRRGHPRRGPGPGLTRSGVRRW